MTDEPLEVESVDVRREGDLVILEATVVGEGEPRVFELTLEEAKRVADVLRDRVAAIEEHSP